MKESSIGAAKKRMGKSIIKVWENVFRKEKGR